MTVIPAGSCLVMRLQDSKERIATALAMPLHHFCVLVPPAKLEGLVTFLKTSLAHLDFKEFLRPVPGMVGMGNDSPYLWIDSYHVVDEMDVNAVQRMLGVTHVAFTAKSTLQERAGHKSSRPDADQT